MILQRRRNRVEPVRATQVVFEIVTWRDGIDAELDNVQARVRGQLHFPQDLLGVVRMLGKNENKRAALLDGASDFAGIRTARHDIARRDPASDAGTLQRRANGIRYRAIVARVGNENIVRHGPNRILADASIFSPACISSFALFLR